MAYIKTGQHHRSNFAYDGIERPREKLMFSCKSCTIWLDKPHKQAYSFVAQNRVKNMLECSWI